MSALGSLESLTRLYLHNNAVADITPLAGMQSLSHLVLNDNLVVDLVPLNFNALQELRIRNNAVQDLSPLLSGGPLVKLAMVDARGNPLSGEPSSALGTLRERGVTVLAGEAVPYFPAAGTPGREGFVRVINRSDADGEVLIAAVDDGGNRFGPARMDVGARRTVHFNSRNLEDGNAAKGLRDGVGRPTVGDWRLEVTSSLDIEVLSYARTDDDFVTAMHDVAAEGMVPFFNPGSNERQRSTLRLVNMRAAESGPGALFGYDDRGVRQGGEYFTVGAEAATSITATALEGVHGLGDGHGKWRLAAPGFPWLAMSLLESPTGHLANLSTVPDNAEPLAGGGARHRVPLFPAAGGARQGFVRVGQPVVPFGRRGDSGGGRRGQPLRPGALGDGPSADGALQLQRLGGGQRREGALRRSGHGRRRLAPRAHVHLGPAGVVLRPHGGRLRHEHARVGAARRGRQPPRGVLQPRQQREPGEQAAADQQRRRAGVSDDNGH